MPSGFTGRGFSRSFRSMLFLDGLYELAYPSQRSLPIFIEGCVMQKRTRVVLALLVLGLGVSCGKKLNPNEILIGEYGSLTGSQATFGISTENGIQLALEEANAAGGVNGKTLKVIVFDDEGKPSEATLGVTKLITQDQVQVVLGE